MAFKFRENQKQLTDGQTDGRTGSSLITAPYEGPHNNTVFTVYL